VPRLTNNPAKTTGLEDYGVAVTERVRLTPHPNDHNLAYLLTKRDRMGHDLPDLGTHTIEGELA
jgi:3,4-dihydroxy 2-butanone 4-phosphate synthase/GTP cyclohydrolase II